VTGISEVICGLWCISCPFLLLCFKFIYFVDGWFEIGWRLYKEMLAIWNVFYFHGVGIYLLISFALILFMTPFFFFGQDTGWAVNRIYLLRHTYSIFFPFLLFLPLKIKIWGSRNLKRKNRNKIIKKIVEMPSNERVDEDNEMTGNKQLCQECVNNYWFYLFIKNIPNIRFK